MDFIYHPEILQVISKDHSLNVQKFLSREKKLIIEAKLIILFPKHNVKDP